MLAHLMFLMRTDLHARGQNRQFFSLYLSFHLRPLHSRHIINVYREAKCRWASSRDPEHPPEPRREPGAADRSDRLTFATSSSAPSASFRGVLDISRSYARRPISFVGPSGAVKTTLVKLLVGLYPGSGRSATTGIGRDRRLNQLREQIGFVTQDTQLFSGTIRENLLFVNPTATDEECLTVLRQAACDSLLARADRGLDTVIGEGGVKVSGGEKQRLSIARALLRHPHLLVFDERRRRSTRCTRGDRRDDT